MFPIYKILNYSYSCFLIIIIIIEITVINVGNGKTAISRSDDKRYREVEGRLPARGETWFHFVFRAIRYGWS